MSVDRREFLKLAAGAAACTTAAGVARSGRAAGRSDDAAPDPIGCLVDTTTCIGCRKCEEACNRSNRLPRPKQPFSDLAVLGERRRPTADAFTVINGHPGAPSSVQQTKDRTYVKVQCMHCVDPACVSACIVGALTKTAEGAVTYDPEKCIGCRYCLIACPFGIPAYEYMNPTTPRVRKCGYCVDEQLKTGANPACAAACPVEAMVFGKRADLLQLARQRIEQRPGRYIEGVYGEHEVGGTSWLYLAGRPFEEIGLPKLSSKAPPRLTEAIQHGLFNYGAAPLALYGGLAGLMWFVGRKKRKDQAGGPSGTEPRPTASADDSGDTAASDDPDASGAAGAADSSGGGGDDE